MKIKVVAVLFVVLVLALAMSMFVFSTGYEAEDSNIIRVDLTCSVEGKTIIMEFNNETETMVGSLECGSVIITLINQSEADFLAFVEWAVADWAPAEPRPLLSRVIARRCPSFYNHRAGDNIFFNHEARTVVHYDRYRNRTEFVASEEELSSFIDLTEWWFYKQYGITLADVLYGITIADVPQP